MVRSNGTSRPASGGVKGNIEGCAKRNRRPKQRVNQVEILNYKPIGKGCLVASLDVVISECGLTIRDCALFEKDGRKWINFPSKEYTTPQGEKKRWDFVTMEKDRKTRFDAACIAQVDKYLLAKQAPSF